MKKKKQPLSVRLNCPMPKMNYDSVILGHGSGGLLMHRLLDKGVFRILDNEWLRRPHDGTVLPLEGKAVISTDSFVVSPLFFPGGNIGDLAVNGTVNDLAMCGAIPRYLSLSLILEEGLKMEDLWEILLSIREACKVAGVEIVTGDTKVVERGKGDGVFINTTGIGSLHPLAKIDSSRVQAGDAIIVSGSIANHGMAIMTAREDMAFETDIETDSRAVNHEVRKLLDIFGGDIRFLRDPTRGGISSTLNELAEQQKLGVRLFEEKIPVRQQVSAICEILGFDPLYVANEGIYVAVVAGPRAEEIIQHMRNNDLDSEASIIGEVTGEHPGQVVLHSRIGGKRIVQMLSGEQLPRIC